jgi:hypothetical protein
MSTSWCREEKFDLILFGGRGRGSGVVPLEGVLGLGSFKFSKSREDLLSRN